jgi:hypothetical protein
MWPPKSPIRGSTFKEKLEIVQSIVTISAVIVGGIWTYNVFIKERREYPHANIEQKLSHVQLSDQINLVRVGIDVTNTGNHLLTIGQSTIRVQQVLPSLPCPNDGACAAKQVNEALQTVDQQSDRFSWPLLAERIVSFDPAVDIEPGEKQSFDFEFVISSKVKVARIYVYVRNDKKFGEGADIGWTASSLYDIGAQKQRTTE